MIDDDDDDDVMSHKVIQNHRQLEIMLIRFDFKESQYIALNLFLQINMLIICNMFIGYKLSCRSTNTVSHFPNSLKL